MARRVAAETRDVFAFLARHAGEPRFLFRLGDAWIAGAGIAAEVRSDGPGRFHDVLDQIRRVRLQSEPGASPVWMGGFAFEPDAPPPFPGARFVLPRTQLEVRGDRASQWELQGPGAQAGPDEGPARDSLGEVAQSEWSERVRAALREIHSGALEKAVLARAVDVPCPTGFDPVDALRRLAASTPTSRLFLFEPTPGRAWFGASPELLVRRDAGRLQTVAIAGSRPRGQTPQEDEAYERALRASSKDAWEHELVCRFLRTAFADEGRPLRVTLDRTTFKLPNVQHLETRFEADSPPGEHILDLAARLHPTPAVAGAPPDEARSLIRRLESAPRGWYAGGVGAFDPSGDGEIAVAIRCARLDRGTLRLYAGCGIVQGSDPAEEWEESNNKLALLRRALDPGRP